MLSIVDAIDNQSVLHLDRHAICRIFASRRPAPVQMRLRLPPKAAAPPPATPPAPIMRRNTIGSVSQEPSRSRSFGRRVASHCWVRQLRPQARASRVGTC